MRMTITWQAADAAAGAIRKEMERVTDPVDKQRLKEALEAMRNASMIYIDDKA